MASLDVARCQCQLEEEKWDTAALLGEKLRQEISCIPGILARVKNCWKYPV